MALYSFAVDIISRSKGQSVVSTAAYNNGVRLKDEYDGVWFDNTSKKDVLFKGILLPEEAPTQLYDLQAFMDALNRAEKRHNSQMAQAFKLALPLELSPEEQLTLLKEFCHQNFISKNQGVNYAIHHGKLVPAKKPDSIPAIGERKDNPHAHLIVPFRRLDKNGFRKTKLESRSRNEAADLIALRKSWADLQNRAFERLGLEVRVSHKSLRDQGLKQIPTIHLGARVYASELKGEITRPVNIYLQVLAERQGQDKATILKQLEQRTEQRIKQEEKERMQAASQKHLKNAESLQQEKQMKKLESKDRSKTPIHER